MQPTPHYVQRAYELLRLERYELALQEVQRALMVNPDDADAHVCGAWILRAQRRWPEAEQAARAGLHADPTSADAQHVLAVALWGQGRVREAEQAFKTTLQQSSGDQTTYLLNYARLLLALNRYQEALSLAAQTLSHAPMVPSAHEIRGRALQALGRFSEAADAYREALRLDPRNIIAQNNLGVLDLAAGHVDAAVERFQTVLRQAPSEEDAQANLLKALKARNGLYRWVTRLRLWVQSRTGRRVNMGLAIALAALIVLVSLGHQFNMRFIDNISAFTGIVLVLIVIGVVVRIFWTLFIESVFNTLLLLDPSHQLAHELLDTADIAITAQLVAMFVTGLLSVIAVLALNTRHPLVELALGWCMVSFCGLIPARFVHGKQRTWRKIAWIYYAIIIPSGYLAVAGGVFRLPVLTDIAGLTVGFMFLVYLVSNFIMNVQRRQKRTM